ncbi:MAG: patatin-like phospholipase family protein, partial [Planctomycetota bacterium]
MSESEGSARRTALVARDGAPPAAQGTDAAPASAPSTSRGARAVALRSAVLAGPIGLSLSGGGFRAAAFHLGVLVALDRAGLRERVEVLSASSAGSIVAARLLFAEARGESFEHAAFELKRFLCEERPLEDAVRLAARTGQSLPSALADVLDGALFADDRGVPARLQVLNETRTHVREFSLEAVSLASGRPFRFAFSRAHEAGVGRPAARVPRRIAEQIRIADAVAASCADLETLDPHRFPTDFDWGDDESARAALEASGGTEHALASGALHDDLAIDALLGAATRGGDAVELFLASDAAWTSDEGTSEAAARPLPGWLTLRRVDSLATLLALGAVAAGGLIALKAEQERAIGDFRLPGDLVAYGVPLLFCAAVVAALVAARVLVRRAVAPLLAASETAERRAVRRTPLRALFGRVHARSAARRGALRRLVPARMRGLVLRGGWSEGRIAPRRATLQPSPLRVESLDLVENLCAPGPELIARTEAARTAGPGFQLEGEESFRALVVAGEAAALARLVELVELRHGP